MRFSYIDSQGKEIEVDSVESLALRIELGAVRPDTRMYDAVADRWAPAEEHPVYRSLSRGEEWDDEDWIAGTGKADADGAREAPESAESAESAEAPEAADEGARADTTGDTAGDSPGDATGDAAGIASGELDPDDPLGLGFTVDMVGEESAPGGGTGREESPPSLPSDPEGDAPGDGPATADGSGPEGEKSDQAAADFGGFGEPGSLELEEDDVSGEPGPREPATPGDADGLRDREEPSEADELTDADVPTDADTPTDTGTPTDADTLQPTDGPEEAEAQTSRSADTESETAPGWLGEGESLWDDEPERGDAASGASQGPADDGTGAMGRRDLLKDDPADPGNRMPEWAAAPSASDAGEEHRNGSLEEVLDEGRDRRQAPRPAHWEDRREAREHRTRLVRIAQFAAVVAVLGGIGGYLLLGSGGFLTEGEAGAGEEPGLGPELRAELVSAAEIAYSDVLQDFRGELQERQLPPAPPAAWLEGIYLATASDYPAVDGYWGAVLDAVSAFQGRERALYVRRLSMELTSRAAEPNGGRTGLSGEEVGRVLEEGRREFGSTAPRRDSIYDGILAMATASIRLHDFLVEREEDIAYEPYSDPGVSRDPVLEAVPADSVLRVEMNVRLDRVIDAIILSGVERPITTEGIFDHLFSALAREGTVAPAPPPAERAGRSSPTPVQQVAETPGR